MQFDSKENGMSKIIEAIEKEQMKESLPELNVGDTVRVSKTIVEGKKKRTQKFEGTIVKIQGSNASKSITIRKIMDKIGVEKAYLLHSPLLTNIEIIQRSKVRRSRLFYLRERVGAKANRLKVKK
jgi:large subunit ribosomal protein L19